MSFIAGIGSTNVDLLYSGMPRLPAEGEEIYSQSFSMQLGGGVPATLINAARLGVSSCVLTFLGDEFFSDYAMQQFLKYKTKPINLFHGKGMPINITSAAITASNRTFVSYSEGVVVDDRMLADAFDAQQGAKIVLMHEDFLPIYPELKRQGAILVYDTGWKENMSIETMQTILELADYYTPNRQEAMLLTGQSSPEKALRVLSKFFAHAIVKIDKDGCLLDSAGKVQLIPSVPNVDCVDSTGAGDAFLAGFVYGLYHDLPIEEAVACGNILGAMCVTKVGCLSAEMNESELKTRLSTLYTRK